MSASARHWDPPPYDDRDPDLVATLPIDVDRAPEAFKDACASTKKAGWPTIAYLACVRHLLAEHRAPSHKVR